MTRPAAHEQVSTPRVLVLDDDRPHDVFDVLGEIDVNGAIVRVRSPYLFEVGEQLAIRIELDGASRDARATVRAHVGPADALITELEIETEPGGP